MPIRFQVDPDFYDHPKALGMSDAAFALWVRTGSYCAAKGTDGFVSDDVLSLFSTTQQEAAPELARRRLWLRVKGGYQFHQFSDRNLTKAVVEAQREADRERKRQERGDTSVTAREATCHSCGHTYVTRRADSKYCSARCRKTASRTGGTGNQQVETQTVRSDSDRIPEGFQTESDRIPDVSVSVSVSESVSGSGHEVSPPPARCADHAEDPDPPPCGRCAEARKNRARWDTDQAARIVERDRNAPRCRTHPTELAHNCRSCAADRKAARPVHYQQGAEQPHAAE